MREREIEQYFIRRVREAGGLQRKFVSPGHKDVFDRIGGFPVAQPFYAEIKSPGEKLRPGQAREHMKWMELGFKTWVLDSKFAVDVFIEYYVPGA